MRGWKLAWVLALVLIPSPGCARLIAGGLVASQALTPISDDQEIAMGAAAVRQITASPDFHLYAEPQVNAYVTRIGREMAAQTSRPRLPWQFIVQDSPTMSAFALPGGFVFVTTGSLKAMTNTAELAGVLGHECSHVAVKDGIQQVKEQLIAQGVLISARGESPQVAQLAGDIAATVVLRGYSREAEYRADCNGAIAMSRAGYDPHELVHFLQVLAQLPPETPSWLGALATHPTAPDRIARLTQEIASRHLEGRLVEAPEFQAAMAPLTGGGAARTRRCCPHPGRSPLRFGRRGPRPGSCKC